MSAGHEDGPSSIPIMDADGDGRDDPIAAGTVINDAYRVLRLLGSGGMGTVVAARRVYDGQVVALKIMHAAMAANPDTLRRFTRESNAAAMLVSEHTARIYEVGKLPTGVPFMAMEYLEGQDLEELAERRKLGIEEAVDYVLQAVAAVSEAHANGLVHRDLKPQNLFLTKAKDGSAQIKVLDFGLAKDLARNDPAQDSGVTTDNMLIGSPHFMSPEQVRSPGGVDGRTDIWALGATLYVLLTGEPPFVSPTMFGLLALIMAEPAPRLCDRKLDAPEALERVILRCLEKDPEKRYATVDDLGAALRDVFKPAAPAVVPFKLDLDEDSGTLVMDKESPAFVPALSGSGEHGVVRARQQSMPPQQMSTQHLPPQHMAPQPTAPGVPVHTPMGMPRPSYASFPALPSQFPPPPPMVPARAAAPATPLAARIVVGIAMAIAAGLVLGALVAVALWALR